MSAPLIRPARVEEAAALTNLALRAKASWGYSADFIEACRQELTITPARVAAGGLWVAEMEGAVAGFLAAALTLPLAEVDDFFVEAAWQRRGLGSALMETFFAACRAAGVTRVEVDADPNAEAIYARFGFRTFARSPSGSIPGRFLPRMALEF